MNRLACKACRTCPGLTLRGMYEEGWRPSSDGSWRRLLDEQTGRDLVNAIAGSNSSRCVEVTTDAFGTRYYEVYR
jgi:hypothetical protein